MTIVQPETFTLTDQEAATLQSAQMARQVFAPRTVRLTDEGIEQALPEVRSVHLWREIDRVEEMSGVILIWAGNLMVSAIPARAFPSLQDAQAFVDACRGRAAGTER